MKKIFALAMMLCLLLCAGCALADEPPFTISPSTGWSWSQTDYMLTIETPGSYTISNWGERDNPEKLDKTLWVGGNVSGEVELTLDNVHLLSESMACALYFRCLSEKSTLNLHESTLTAPKSAGVYMMNDYHDAEINLGKDVSMIGGYWGIVISGNTMEVNIIGDDVMIEGNELGIGYDTSGFAKLTVSGKNASIKGGLDGIQAAWATGAEFDVSGEGAVIEGSGGSAINIASAVESDAKLVIDGDGAQIKGSFYGVYFSGKSLQNAEVTLGKNVTISAKAGYGSALDLRGKNNALYILGEDDPGVEMLAGEDEESAEDNRFGPFTAKSENIYDQIKDLRARFLKTRVLDLVDPAGADSLPKTGDPSMLGAWLALLGMSAAGMKMRKKH